MRSSFLIPLGLVSLLSYSVSYANEDISNDVSAIDESASVDKVKLSEKLSKLQAQLKVNATAAQDDELKDPFQAFNRKVYAFNDVLDQNIVRPVAVQYAEKIPEDVRSTYTQFRINLNEPRNIVNQLIQGRPLAAANSLGRFTINTLTTFGLADPARRLGLENEEEKFGHTLGYYGVPSGPYIMLPIIGPSTVRDGFGSIIDSQMRPQKYILDNHEVVYWSDQVWRGIDTRAELLKVEDVLTGDKYAQLRDIYLQRTQFLIAQKKGQENETLFMNDDLEDDIEDQDENEFSDN